MRILAIDASINNIGWAILDSEMDIDGGQGLLGSGTLRTKKKGDAERVLEIGELLRAMIKLNNQDFPNKTPIMDIDPAENPYSKQHEAAVKSLRIGIAIIEKPEGFTYDRNVSRRTGKAMILKALAQNNFAVGIIAASLLGLVDKIEFVSAQTWKGKQRKSVTRMIMNNIFGLKLVDKNNDESDAIGIGCWRARRFKLEQKIKESELDNPGMKIATGVVKIYVDGKLIDTRISQKKNAERNKS